MKIQTAIERKLREALQPTFLHIENESHSHNVPPNSETHFRVTIVSEEFEGEKALSRHRRVYKLLEEERAAGVHALAIQAHSPEEWEVKENRNPGLFDSSPPCRGG